jgi:TRAP-type mannitol/chloroaromatic compound transport system permease small subunit
MKHALRLAHAVDELNERVGRVVYWLILVMVLISAGNAVSRKAFDLSSNAFLEIQWYLFSAVFLLAAGYTLKRNEHVRIDVLSGRLSQRAQAWIDIVGALLFLLPLTLVVLYHAWPYFTLSFTSREWSSNPGGLIIWPAKALIPAGFVLLLLQGLAEVIKRVGFLRGLVPFAPVPRTPHSEDLGGITPCVKDHVKSWDRN